MIHKQLRAPIEPTDTERIMSLFDGNTDLVSIIEICLELEPMPVRRIHEAFDVLTTAGLIEPAINAKCNAAWRLSLGVRRTQTSLSENKNARI